jgi:serine/threonine protein kinase
MEDRSLRLDEYGYLEQEEEQGMEQAEYEQGGYRHTGAHELEEELKAVEFDNRDREYNWVKIIGQGSFGTVYKAYNLKTNHTVAIKKVYQDPKYRNREFSLVVDLNHTNVIRVHSHFFTKSKENESEVYLNLVMDYIPNTLYKLLRYYSKTNQVFPPILAKLLSYQMLRSLAYIKGLNICHRDIKPQNVLVDSKDYRLVLCDFGSAKRYESSEESVAYICSRYYRSPELILGAKYYGCEVDAWAVGCVIGEMLVGEPLFLGGNNKEQFLRIVKVLGPPTAEELQAMGYLHHLAFPKFAPAGLRNKIGRDADPLVLDLIAKLLAYHPAKRLQPFRALAHPYFDELRNHRLLLNNRPIVNLFNFSEEEVGKDSHLLAKLVPEWYRDNN